MHQSGKKEDVNFRRSRDGKSKDKSAEDKNQNLIKIVGKFVKSRYFGTVIPDSKLIDTDVYIPYDKFNGANDGDKVFCEIVTHSLNKKDKAEYEGKILKVFGQAGEIKTELEAIYDKYNIVQGFSNPANDEVNNINDEIDLTGRIDYRDKVCITIDPEDAKDFDDAVSIEKTDSSGYILGIHIADVSHYVIQNSPIDSEALSRGTSVYLVNKVVPMLPEKLSNEICSLKEKKERLTFSVLINLDKTYKVKGYEIKESVINSHKRFSYEEVHKILKRKKGDFHSELALMYRISQKLLAQRLKSGSLDFETTEVDIKVNEQNDITNIIPKPRLDSMRMIEEFMLLANKCVTEFVYHQGKNVKSELPFIFRIHDKPDGEKLQTLTQFVKQFGYNINLTNKNSLITLLESVKGREEEFVINDLLIRAMAKAKYSDKNIGHYGLGFDNYTHFTSPIRRYPDLMVHRLIKHYLKIDKTHPVLLKESKYKLAEICRISTEKEQAAVSAEREYIKILQIHYLRKYIGDEFEGVISGITSFGMYVELKDILIEGLVRFRNMEDDYYDYDERRLIVIGKRRKKTFKAGQKVKVKVINASLETKKIDLAIV